MTTLVPLDETNWAEHFTAHEPSIVQQCYDARRELPEALGAWIRNVRLHWTGQFAWRALIASRLSRRFTKEELIRYRKAAKCG